MKPSATSTSKRIRQQIAYGGERLWRHADFRDLPSGAVAQTLSRLARAGKLRRVSKGVYFRPRQTAFGESKPNPAALQQLATHKLRLFSAGIIAANQLGLTTQQPKKREIATTASSVSAKQFGDDVIVHTRRPVAWNQLSDTEATILDVLRRRAEHSELTPDATIQRLLTLLRKDRCLEHLMQVAPTEPPRVRALLGALAEQLGAKQTAISEIKASLNPLSKFDFGLLNALKYAKKWQAKECLQHATSSTS